eukprot:COSAG02_NODE_1732_length_11170_cov_15.656942_9_plen_153_part_00
MRAASFSASTCIAWCSSAATHTRTESSSPPNTISSCWSASNGSQRGTSSQPGSPVVETREHAHQFDHSSTVPDSIACSLTVLAERDERRPETRSNLLELWSPFEQPWWRCVEKKHQLPAMKCVCESNHRDRNLKIVACVQACMTIISLLSRS